MSHRRDRVTILASDGAGDEVAVTGRLETFRVDVREDYDLFTGRRTPSADAEVRVTLVLYLDPAQAEMWKSRTGRSTKLTGNRSRTATRELPSVGGEIANPLTAFQRTVHRQGDVLGTAPSRQAYFEMWRIAFDRTWRVLQLLALDAPPETLRRVSGRISHERQLAWPPR